MVSKAELGSSSSGDESSGVAMCLLEAVFKQVSKPEQ
jgi:hypothetical protein